MPTFQELLDLALAARPLVHTRDVDDDDDGSDRQATAEAAFFDAIKESIPEPEYYLLEVFRVRATLDESLNEALRVARDAAAARSYPNVQA